RSASSPAISTMSSGRGWIRWSPGLLKSCRWPRRRQQARGTRREALGHGWSLTTLAGRTSKADKHR
ncbi:MAG: hypothetical protein ACREIS_11595, partial [Nitrospiraceae bacterium]